MQQNFYSSINGNVIGTNYGAISQSFDVVREIDPTLAGLLNKLTQNQTTKQQAESLINDLAKTKDVEENQKKGLLDKIVSGAEKLKSLAESSKILYPIAVAAFEIIKNIKF